MKSLVCGCRAAGDGGGAAAALGRGRVRGARAVHAEGVRCSRGRAAGRCAGAPAASLTSVEWVAASPFVTSHAQTPVLRVLLDDSVLGEVFLLRSGSISDMQLCCRLLPVCTHRPA